MRDEITVDSRLSTPGTRPSWPEAYESMRHIQLLHSTAAAHHFSDGPFPIYHTASGEETPKMVTDLNELPHTDVDTAASYCRGRAPRCVSSPRLLLSCSQISA